MADAAVARPGPSPTLPQRFLTTLINAADGKREFVLFFLAFTFILLCPFSKVEESFHMQATHDVLVHGVLDVSQYDHLQFPGVVPRTFLGALGIAAVAWPWRFIFQYLGVPKLFLQVAVRATLALGVCLSYRRLMDVAALRLSHRTARAMMFVACLTPHFMFYASRTLPNTFALFMTINGVAEWMHLDLETSPETLRQWSPVRLCKALAWFICATLWLRCDMVVLLAPICFTWLAMRKATFWQLAWNGVWIGVVALATTVAVDSYFWQRPMWPEGGVLYFNAVENRSHEYGVSPWHWYWLSALPRAFLAMLVPVPLGLITLGKRARLSSGAAGSSSNKKDDDATTAPTLAAPPTLARQRLAQQPEAAASSGAPAAGAPEAAQRVRRSSDASAPSATQPPVAATPSTGAREEVFWSQYSHLSVLQLLARIRIDADIAEFCVPFAVFVALYSLLPHKELRFLMPAFPLLHIPAARGLSKLYRLGEALLWGLSTVRPQPEAAAAELIADAVESAVTAAVPEAVATAVSTPRGVLLRRRRMRFSEESVEGLAVPPAAAATSAAPAPAAAGTSAPTAVAASVVPPTPADAADDADLGRLSLLRRLLGLALLAVVAAMLVANAVATGVYVRVSMSNYPGGEALQRLYTLYAADTTARLQALASASSPSAGAAASVRGARAIVPVVPLGTAPPCPYGDVTAHGVWEWWRQCIDAKEGCPQAAPWTAAFLPPTGGALTQSQRGTVCVDPLGTAHTTGVGHHQPALYPLTVHISNLAAQTGVTRFGEAWSSASGSSASNGSSSGGLGGWRYDKTEHLTRPDDYRGFTYVLAENTTLPVLMAADFEVVESIYAVTRFDWRRMRVVSAPALFILQNRRAAGEAEAQAGATTGGAASAGQ